MKTALSLFVVLLIVGGLIALYQRIQMRQLTKSRRKPAPWHLSNVENNTAFNFFGTYEQAIAEMRHRIPGALIVLVDDEMFVIFFKIPSKS